MKTGREFILKVMTVAGEVKPDELGITLPHEHLLFDATCYFSMPEESTGRYLAESKLTITNLGEIKRKAFANKDNLFNNDLELALREVFAYKRAGGRSLVDLTNIGIGRDPLALRAISLQTGLNIVAGCGFYIAASHPKRVESMSSKEISKEIVNDITNGIGGTDVKAGIIGEIGTSWPMVKSEEKVLRGAAQAQIDTGLTLNIHPFCGWPVPWAKDAHKLLDIVEEEGVELSRVVLSHMDCNGFDIEEHASLAKRGAYIEYDTFGSELYYTSDVWDPRDTERVQGIISMLRAGLGSQLLISQDVCYKVHLKSYGGNGYDHILTNIVPMLRVKGVAEKEIRQLKVENPRNMLVGEQNP